MMNKLRNLDQELDIEIELKDDCYEPTNYISKNLRVSVILNAGDVVLNG